MSSSFRIIVGTILLIFIILCILGSSDTGDDAFISFRYAQNLINGKGLTFNEGERVEGYTNFLWVILMAGGMLFSDPVPASKVLGLMCSCAFLWFFARFTQRQMGRGWWIAATLLAVDYSLIRCTTRGLETPLFILLVWLAYQQMCRGDSYSGLSGIFSALAAMTRPEGALLVVFLPFCYLGELKKNSKKIGVFYFTNLIFLGPYLIWKLMYYGNLLPNTFYAKTGGGMFQLWRGAAYITQSWSWLELGLVLIVISGVVFQRNNRIFLLASAIGTAFFFGVVAVGGDSLGPNRFMAPIAPFLYFTFAFSVCRLLQLEKFKRMGQVILVVAVILLGAVKLKPLYPLILNPRIYSADAESQRPRTKLGRCLAQNTLPGDSVATSLIGRVPYYSGLYTMDVLGLIDPYIAHLKPESLGSGAAGHEKMDAGYILSKQPTFIISPEVLVNPPKEYGWLKALRQYISGDPPVVELRFLTPPFEGYERIELDCSGIGKKIWKRVTPGERSSHIHQSTWLSGKRVHLESP